MDWPPPEASREDEIILALHREGWSQSRIGRLLKRSHQSIGRRLAQLAPPQPQPPRRRLKLSEAWRRYLDEHNVGPIE